MWANLLGLVGSAGMMLREVKAKKEKGQSMKRAVLALSLILVLPVAAHAAYCVVNTDNAYYAEVLGTYSGPSPDPITVTLTKIQSFDSIPVGSTKSQTVPGFSGFVREFDNFSGGTFDSLTALVDLDLSIRRGSTGITRHVVVPPTGMARLYSR